MEARSIPRALSIDDPNDLNLIHASMIGRSGWVWLHYHRGAYSPDATDWKIKGRHLGRWLGRQQPQPDINFIHHQMSNVTGRVGLKYKRGVIDLDATVWRTQGRHRNPTSPRAVP